MAISNASRLADFGTGIGTEGAAIQIDNVNQRVGIGTTNPQGTLQVGTGVTIYGNSGIVSATSFYGDGSNLSAVIADSATTATYASTAGIATIAQGLTGTPNITVGVITASSAEFSGNVSIAGTLTYEDVTNVDSIGLITARSGVRINTGGLVVTSGVSTLSTLIPDETRFVSVSEKLTRIDGNTVNLVYNSGGSNIGLATNPSDNITLAVTGIPTSSDFDNHTLTFSVFVNQTGTARSCTAVTLNGFNATIRWAGGSLANAISGVTTTSGMDIYSFTGINTVGSAATTANYYVLGVVNGGYR
jgi:hypothetical protein